MIIARVGMDIAAAKYNVWAIVGTRDARREFNNSPQGISECWTWLKKTGATHFHIVLEPTGRYHELVAESFCRFPNCRVFDPNPKTLKDFAGSLDLRTKTDWKDAHAMAFYAKERAGEPAYNVKEYQPKTPAQLDLRDLSMRMRSLTKRASSLKGQLECGISSRFVRDSMNEEIVELEAQKDLVLDEAKKVIAADPQLANDYELLLSIPGIGEKSAVLLLCVVDFRRFKNGRSVACFLGLTPRRHTSGDTIAVKERISKVGSKEFRSGMYWPAVTAMKHPLFAQFAQRLTDAGKTWSCAKNAVLRKIVVIAWSLIKSGRKFDANYVSKAVTPI